MFARTVEWHHTLLNICSSALPARHNYGTIQMRWLIFSSSTTTDKRGELWAATTITTTLMQLWRGAWKVEHTRFREIEQSDTEAESVTGWASMPPRLGVAVSQARFGVASSTLTTYHFIVNTGVNPAATFPTHFKLSKIGIPNPEPFAKPRIRVWKATRPGFGLSSGLGR